MAIRYQSMTYYTYLLTLRSGEVEEGHLLIKKMEIDVIAEDAEAAEQMIMRGVMGADRFSLKKLNDAS